MPYRNNEFKSSTWIGGSLSLCLKFNKAWNQKCLVSCQNFNSLIKEHSTYLVWNSWFPEDLLSFLIDLSQELGLITLSSDFMILTINFGNLGNYFYWNHAKFDDDLDSFRWSILFYLIKGIKSYKIIFSIEYSITNA